MHNSFAHKFAQIFTAAVAVDSAVMTKGPQLHSEKNSYANA